MDVTKNTRKKITLVFIHLFWFGVVFLNQNREFASGIMWILLLQTCQLIAEYIRRKIEKKKGKVG